MNLLNETLEALARNGHGPQDVRWVANNTQWMSWDEFAAQALGLEYDAGYGTAEIIGALQVVGENFWLERWEYDGSEGWSCKRLPSRPPEHAVFRLTYDD